MSANERPMNIVFDVRTHSKQADGAAALSLYVYPKLDPSLASITLTEALWWIPRMNSTRHRNIYDHIRVPLTATFGDLTKEERKALAGYLDDMRAYARYGKGQTGA